MFSSSGCHHYAFLSRLRVTPYCQAWQNSQWQTEVSAIIGAAEMYDCIPSENRDGHYHHLMKHPILFEKYVPNVSGARNYWSPKTPEHIKAFNQAWQQIQAQQPRAVFKIHYKDGIISVSNSRTANDFQVKDAGVWQTLVPRLQGEEIALTKLEYADLYRSRLA